MEVGKELEGSTPPSVFIGSWNYPKVYAGPMISPVLGDTAIMDTPEAWIPGSKSQEDIISYRMSLVRGKKLIGITDLDNQMVEKLQEISLASGSIDSEAEFWKKTKRSFFQRIPSPSWASAILEKFDIDNVRWDRELEKVYYDTDLRARDAIMDLHSKDVPFSHMQKAFSVGTMGVDKRRRLVPTRWSITACDSTIADQLLKEVKHFDPLDVHRVYEFQSLQNYYAVLLLPSPWQYEWMEAFLKVLGQEKLIFSDYENYNGKKKNTPELVAATTPVKWQYWRHWLKKNAKQV